MLEKNETPQIHVVRVSLTNQMEELKKSANEEAKERSSLSGKRKSELNFYFFIFVYTEC